MVETAHRFHALAYAENFSLKALAAALPEARRGPHELRLSLAGGGELFLYRFGAAVLRDCDAAVREAALARLRRALPGLGAEVASEEFAVVEGEGTLGVEEGVLHIDRLTGERAGVVALIVAQSSATEYYERIIDEMFKRANANLDRLEATGRGPWRIRPLHRFIAAAALTRNEVLAVLHLLDKPDAVWDDAALDRIYADLRAEFDLADRYDALSRKLTGLQESLGLLLDVTRESRLFTLEVTVILLIVLEIVIGLYSLR